MEVNSLQSIAFSFMSHLLESAEILDDDQANLVAEYILEMPRSLVLEYEKSQRVKLKKMLKDKYKSHCIISILVRSGNFI